MAFIAGFATCRVRYVQVRYMLRILTCRILYLLHSTTVSYAHIMSIIYQFLHMIYGNICGSYLKKILSNSTKDSSNKHMASPWKLRQQLLSLPLANLEKRPLVWKRFIDDIFSLWNISMKDAYNFVDFANSFHPTIRFTCET